MQQKIITPQILTISEVLSAPECFQEVLKAEVAGFKIQNLNQDTETRSRAMIKEEAKAQLLWERISSLIPPLTQFSDKKYPILSERPIQNYQAFGLNPLFRYYKYDLQERFTRHIDYSYQLDEHSCSFLTVLLYLNDDFDGGETVIEDEKIAPQAGMAVIFPHEMFHQGLPVLANYKYVMRTDVMFRYEG